MNSIKKEKERSPCINKLKNGIMTTDENLSTFFTYSMPQVEQLQLMDYEMLCI